MQKYVFISQLITLFLFGSNAVSGQGWDLKARFSAGSGFSNNVFESLSNPVADVNARLGLRVEVKSPRSSGLGSLRFGSNTGLDSYAQYAEENRILQQTTFRFSGPGLGRLLPGLMLKHRYQRFFTIERGYGMLLFQPNLAFRVMPRLKLHGYYVLNRFDWILGSDYDSESDGYGFFLSWLPFSGLSVDVQWSRLITHFDRFAYTRQTAPTFWQALDVSQKDRSTQISCWIEFYHEALFRIGYSQKTNRSNSYGYAYHCPKLTFLISRQLTPKWTFTIYFNMQQKQYSDDLSPVFLIHPDTEREDNNYLMVTIDRDLSAKTSLQFKGGSTRNESPFRSRYYNKTFFHVGIITRF